MKIIHAKSLCCEATIQLFGNRRRRCAQCGKTWTIRPRKRGARAKRINRARIEKVFRKGLRVKHLIRAGEGYDSVQKMFSKQLTKLVNQPRNYTIAGKKLVLIIDAQWHCFGKSMWTIYFLAVKPCNADTAWFLDPIMKFGKESATHWNEVMDQMPEVIKKRVSAVVSDGIKGIINVAEQHNWLLQRCHFHLLSLLQKQRGKRISTLGRKLRENIYQTVKILLREVDKKKSDKLQQQLKILSEHPLCPKRMRMQTRDFIRNISFFHTYLRHPKLDIPYTTNVMESANSMTKKNTAKINNPYAWFKWTKMSIRMHPKFNCKGANFNRN